MPATSTFLALAPGTRTALLPARPRTAVLVRIGSLRSTLRAMRTGLLAALLLVPIPEASVILFLALRVPARSNVGPHFASPCYLSRWLDRPDWSRDRVPRSGPRQRAESDLPDDADREPPDGASSMALVFLVLVLLILGRLVLLLLILGRFFVPSVLFLGERLALPGREPAGARIGLGAGRGLLVVFRGGA